ncbi:hypothetical protein AVEN_76081-1, partial [Araneus ventricosus]
MDQSTYGHIGNETPDSLARRAVMDGISTLLSIDILQLIYTDFMSYPQIYAAVEKWALQFTPEHHARSPLL